MTEFIDTSEAQLPKFYAGRSVFITGATGFMGKVLVERLLSTCPDVSRLYLLMRQKKHASPEERLTQLKQSQVFDRLRQTNPRQLEKLLPVAGDVTEPLLGMTPDTIAQLKPVSVIFHSAANVKLNDDLANAVNQNVRSVMRLLDVCDKLPNLEVFVHVSTAYSNSDLKTVKEQVYPPLVELEQLLDFVDNTPHHIVSKKTAEYIAPKPNTYAFTKAMAETIIAERKNKQYSAVIFRPTIVISSKCYPFPGWIENLNGPTGVIVSCGKGLLKVMCVQGSARADMLPVDIAIDTLIAVAWDIATQRPASLRVYNCTTIENPVTWTNFTDMLNKVILNYPLKDALWYPYLYNVANRYLFRTLEFSFHTTYIRLLHYITMLFGSNTKINYLRVGEKVSSMIDVLSYFSLREWNFINTNCVTLRKRLTKEDAAIFNLDTRTINWNEHLEDFVKGTRQYALKETDEDLEKAKQRLRKLNYLQIATKTILMVVFLRLISLFVFSTFTLDKVLR